MPLCSNVWALGRRRSNVRPAIKKSLSRRHAVGPFRVDSGLSAISRLKSAGYFICIDIVVYTY